MSGATMNGGAAQHAPSLAPLTEALTGLKRSLSAQPVEASCPACTDLKDRVDLTDEPGRYCARHRTWSEAWSHGFAGEPVDCFDADLATLRAAQGLMEFWGALPSELTAIERVIDVIEDGLPAHRAEESAS